LQHFFEAQMPRISIPHPKHLHFKKTSNLFTTKQPTGCSGSATSAKKYEQRMASAKDVHTFFESACGFAETNGTKRWPCPNPCVRPVRDGVRLLNIIALYNSLGSARDPRG